MSRVVCVMLLLLVSFIPMADESQVPPFQSSITSVTHNKGDISSITFETHSGGEIEIQVDPLHWASDIPVQRAVSGTVSALEWSRRDGRIIRSGTAWPFLSGNRQYLIVHIENSGRPRFVWEELWFELLDSGSVIRSWIWTG